MFFRELLELVPQLHPSRDMLEKAARLMFDVSTSVNEQMNHPALSLTPLLDKLAPVRPRCLDSQPSTSAELRAPPLRSSTPMPMPMYGRSTATWSHCCPPRNASCCASSRGSSPTCRPTARLA